MASKQIRLWLTLSEKEKDYLVDAYKRYVSLSTGDILTMNKWILNRIIEAIKNEAE